MKKINILFLLILSMVVFYSCEDTIEGTEDLNYVSFEGATKSVTVEKNSTADAVVKVYSTQVAGSERTFSINVVGASTTADAGSYVVPATVVIPANSNVGEFTINFSDVNIADSGVKLVLSFNSEEGLYTGKNMTLNIFRLCPFNINDFIGNYIITEAGYGDYATTITKDAGVANRIWITNFWDWTNDLLYLDFNPENGSVTVPEQVVTMGDGNEYTVVGSGTYNACAGTFHVEYGGDVDGTIHDFNPEN